QPLAAPAQLHPHGAFLDPLGIDARAARFAKAQLAAERRQRELALAAPRDRMEFAFRRLPSYMNRAAIKKELGAIVRNARARAAGHRASRARACRSRRARRPRARGSSAPFPPDRPVDARAPARRTAACVAPHSAPRAPPLPAPRLFAPRAPGARLRAPQGAWR